MQRRWTAVLTTAVLAAGSALAVGAPAADAGAPPPTRSITVSGADTSTYPAFDAAVTRYGVRTTATTGGAVTVTASTTDPGGTITIDGRPATSGTSVPLSGLGDGDEVAVRITDSAGTTSYGFIYLPAGFPAVTATSSGAGPSDGLVFLNFSSFLPSPPIEAVLDEHGVPAYVASAGTSNDLKLQPDGRYSIARPTTTPGRTGQRIAALDAAFDEVDSYETVGLVNTDFHDSILEPDGSALLMAYEPDDHSGGVTDAMIQELDPAGSVAFEWDSEDHIPVGDALLGTSIGDYAHINSLDVMDGGDILASFRNTSQVLRIARTAHDGFQPGDVVWRLGGVSSDFTFVDDPEGGFCAQHTARQLDDGNILIFDNGAAQASGPFGPQTGDVCPGPDEPGQRRARPFSRVVEYELDEEEMEARLVWEHVPGRYAQFAGSSQRLPSGNTMIGWFDASPLATEVDAEGNEVWRLSAPGRLSYRALKFDAPDAIDPVVDLVTPADGATFARDAVIPADYGCTDTGGSTMQTCVGPVVPGTALDTATPGPHEFTVTTTDGEGNTAEVTHTYTVAAGPHQADGVIRRQARGPWIGNGRYDADGTGQTVVLNGRPGRVVTALVRVQNDGDEDGALRLQGSRNTGSFQVRYVRGTQDVSAAVKAGTFTTPEVPSGGYFPLRVEITVKSTAAPGAEHRVRIAGAPVADLARADTVVAVARATA